MKALLALFTMILLITAIQSFAQERAITNEISTEAIEIVVPIPIADVKVDAITQAFPTANAVIPETEDVVLVKKKSKLFDVVIPMLLSISSLAFGMLLKHLAGVKKTDRMQKMCAVLFEGSEVVQDGLEYMFDPSKANLEKAKKEFKDVILVAKKELP